jgi:hypothetical protein
VRQMNQSLLPPGAGGRMMDPSQAVKLGVLLGSGSFGRCAQHSPVLLRCPGGIVRSYA